MSNKIIILLIFTTIPIIWITLHKDQTQAEIIGIWNLTDYNNPDKFEDTWEFKSDGIFNELKYESDLDTIMAPDGHGIWTLKNNQLDIKVTGELHNGKIITYDKSQQMNFKISKNEDAFILDVIEDGFSNEGILLLRKRI